MVQDFKMKIGAVLACWLFADCMTALAASPSAPKVGQSAAAGPRPNVIVLMTDDQGYGEFSIHGNPIARTPNIDRLGTESIRLTNFHVAPMCTPTRGQLLTGIDAFRNGAMNVSSGRTLLRADLKTMADVFREAGYRTGIFGKWHLGDNYPFRPEDRGFDEAIWFPSSHISSLPDYWDNDYFDDTYHHNGKREKLAGYCTDVFFCEAKRWIAETAPARPFFVYLPLNAAHGPWFVPKKYRQVIQQAMDEHPEVAAHLKPARREALIRFLAMGANIDENVGRLDQFLSDSGLRENTIIVFLTDNGSTLGPDYFNAGMRGGKTTLWEGGHRVPCFIRWPGGAIGPPREIGELCQVQDLLPTLADLAGLTNVPQKLDGTSLVPLFRGKHESLKDRMLVINYSRMPSSKLTDGKVSPALPQRDGAAVLWKQWRLLENRELYDVGSDPHQDHDVSAKYPEVVEKMRAHLDKWWNGVKDRAMVPQRVVIGNDAENPMMLSACEWLNVFVDQQRQVRQGDRKNGVWHLVVDRDGLYSFELRRWPKESHVRLDEGVTVTPVTDGRYVAGRPIAIASARMRIGNQELAGKPQTDGESVQFRLNLKVGSTELQTWFMDSAGQSICGAYYVYVHRE
jgi:arylsulfatase A-like enzyme